MRSSIRAAVWLFTSTLLVAAPAQATWSIIIIDTQTREIGVAGATCLTGFDLKVGLPVVRVGLGAGCAQSAVDVGAVNRLRIYNALGAGTAPATILQQLAAADPAHQTRQYGIVDTQGRAITFSGAQNGAYAGGRVGQDGTLVYAVQGNVITGQPVIDEAEYAILSTPGGIPDKLMRAMEAAASLGGDGRCSCSASNPPGCGSPPEQKWQHSAYIGFLIVARRGDTDAGCNGARGCAAGSYYMALNYATGSPSRPDPVIVLRQQFDQFRATRVGVADAIASRASFDAPALPAIPGRPAEMLVELLDWRGDPATIDAAVQVVHDAPDSAAVTTIEGVTPLGDGRFRVKLSSGGQVGVDRFAISVSDAFGTRVLTPSPTLQSFRPADADCDGSVVLADIDPFLLAIFDPAAYAGGHPACPRAAADVNLDGRVDLFDIDAFVACLIDEVCP